MERQRIILVSGSHLLEEMLKKIIQKTENLQVVQEIEGENSAPSPDQVMEADWLIEALPLSQKLADWVKQYKQTHPQTSSLRMAVDSNQVKVKRRGKNVSIPSNFTLPILLKLLQGSGDFE
jgi:hypothetical protein